MLGEIGPGDLNDHSNTGDLSGVGCFLLTSWNRGENQEQP